jgi:hypothetical protein
MSNESQVIENLIARNAADHKHTHALIAELANKVDKLTALVETLLGEKTRVEPRLNTIEPH